VSSSGCRIGLSHSFSSTSVRALSILVSQPRRGGLIRCFQQVFHEGFEVTLHRTPVALAYTLDLLRQVVDIELIPGFCAQRSLLRLRPGVHVGVIGRLRHECSSASFAGRAPCPCRPLNKALQVTGAHAPQPACFDALQLARAQHSRMVLTTTLV
jgi:hypothetical protein